MSRLAKMTDARATGGVKTNFPANARKAWGEALPEWVLVLAVECGQSSATVTAKRLGYSVAVVSAVVRGNYKGDLGKVEAKVRGAFMGEVLDCPVLGEIARDRCVTEQGRKFVATSALRAKLFRACKSCGFSRKSIVEAKEAADVAA